MNSREKFLKAAKRLFAENGFDRTSIASIADELGLTKQALLHHFGSKKALYSVVLKETANRQGRIAKGLVNPDDPPVKKLETILVASFENAIAEPLEAQLLMRELLENTNRSKTAGTWYLKPAIEMLADIVLELPGWENATHADALIHVYQLLGAINYFAISQPTLRQMFGADKNKQMRQVFETHLKNLIKASVQHPPILGTDQ